jgi:trans-aconitate methyltransferase
MSESFDKFSKNYNSFLNSALDPTGWDYKDFVNAKLQKLKYLFPYLVKEDFQILDFGCGVWNLFGSIPDFFPRASYTGIDTSRESIREAQSKFPDNADFHEFDSDDWKRKKYDLIFSAGVFHHIQPQKHDTLIKSLSAQLNPNGKIVIWKYNPLNPFTRKNSKRLHSR